MRMPERAVGSLLLVIGLAAGAVVCAQGDNAASVPGGPADGTRIVGPRASGRAVIHVYALKRFFFFGTAALAVDGEEIAQIGDGEVCDLGVAPGRYTLEFDRPENALTVEIAGGAEQYVRFTPNRVRWGKLRGRTEIVPPATAVPETRSLTRFAVDLTNPASPPASQPRRLTPVRYLLLLAAFALTVALVARAYSGPNDNTPGVTFVLAFVAACVVGFIPAPFVFGWLPVGALVGLLAFDVALAGVAFALFKGPFSMSRRDALAHMGLVFVAVFYVGLLPAWALSRWTPSLLSGVSGFGLLRSAGLAALAAAAIGLNILLAIALEASRDLSGAYEKSTRARWVTQDGRHFRDALKWQTGEWTAPVRTGAKVLLLNVFIVSAAAYTLHRFGWLSATTLLLASAGLVLLAWLVTILRARE